VSRALRRLLALLLFASLGAVALAVAILAFGHWSIRQVDPPLPEAARVLAAIAQDDLPVRLSYINTASQAMPRSVVLDSARDPDPDAPYVMAHSAFALEWADGRLFLVDLGMDRDAALDFGAPIELLGGEPIEPHGDVVHVLGDAASRVAGIAFTHLHVDHVAGLVGLCGALGRDARVFWTPLQREGVNHTSWAGHSALDEAGCARLESLERGPLYAVPGFPGLVVIAAGGHTPGSQVFVARVRGAQGPVSYAITGDVVNHLDGVREDLPKPGYYSLLVVPEDTERLARVRAWLRGLERDAQVRLLVGHDLAALEQSGVPRYPPSPAAR